MAYTNAVYYMDYVNGVDTARGAKNIESSTSATPIKIKITAHGYVTGAVVVVASHTTNTNANGTWKITYVDADNFTLDTSVGNGTGGATGTVTPFGGSSWADAWKTITAGPTSARIAPGDIVRIAKSPSPTSLGQTAQWTSPGTATSAALPTTKSATSSANASGLVRIYCSTPHGFSSGDAIRITNHNVASVNDTWCINVIDANYFDLLGSIYVSNGTTATLQKMNQRAVILSTAVTQKLDNCLVAWTPGAQTTSSNTNTSYYKEHASSIAIVTASTCNANQILAKVGLPAALDLNAGNYQQISFWLRPPSSTALAAGDLQIRLYGEAACTTLRDTLNVPAILSISSPAFIPITIDFGSNLGTGGTIQGLAVYTTVQFNSKTFYVDNFIACKASNANDSLTLQSLISKNTLAQTTNSHTNMGDEGWYAIQSIHGRVVMLDLDAGTSAPTSSYGGYCGETEAVTTYKRETIKTALVNSQYTTIQEIQDSGTAGNIIQFQGGWTINGNQDGETFFDGLMGYGYGLYASSKNYITINNIAVFRYYIGVYFSSGQDITFNMISNVNNCSYYGFSVASITRLTITTLANCNNIAGYGNSITISSITTLTVTDIINSHSNYYGPTISSIGGSITNIKNICGHYSTSFTLGITSGTVGTISNMKWNGGTLSVANANNMTISEITNVTYNVGYVGITGNSCVIAQITNITNNASTYGLYFTGSMNTIQNVTACSGSTYGVCFNGGFNAIYGGTIGGVTCAVYSTSSVANYLNHVVLNGTEFSAAGAGYTYSNNHDNQSGASYISTQYGTITSDTTANRHTASGICWKFSPTSSSATISNPLRMIIARIACAANSPVTFSAYVKKSSAGDIGCKLVIYPYQLNGVTLTTVTKDDNTNYDNLTLPTFTPSESGVIEVEAQVYWVANTADESVYIDDISVSQ